MDTCQTSIKTDILFSALVLPIVGTRDHHMFPTKLTLSGKVMRQNNDLPNKYRRSATETFMYPIGQNTPVILSIFRN